MDHQQTGRKNYGRTGGVYVIIKESVRLFAPGSALRGIPHKEWEIPLPILDPTNFCFYPDADVIAFTKLQEAMCVLFRMNKRCELISMQTGSS